MWDREFYSTHFRSLTAAVLLLAGFNLTFRINDTAITEWDESLYAMSAVEMIESGDWVATRLHGQVDDTIITKPPLTVWLTALSFKTFGITPFALRLTSVVSAWLTVWLLVLWARRAGLAMPAIIGGAVLATSFGFMNVHSGRTGNTDALFTLLTTLTAFLLFRSFAHPYARVGLGLVLAAAFLLRGPGMLMPLALVVLVEAWHRPAPKRWSAFALAALLFAAPVSIWALARARLDGGEFLSQMWKVDLLARALSPFEGHSGTPLYYFDMLQRYHYEWLVAAATALILFRPKRSQAIEWLRERVDNRATGIVLASWALVTFAIPTVMQTKLSWYLNSFYPVFALLVGILLSDALIQSRSGTKRRRVALVAVMVLAFCVAEGKMLYEANRRDKDYVLQGLLERERAALAGSTIYRTHWNGAEQFVVTRLVGARVGYLDQPDKFLDVSQAGDFLVAAGDLSDPRLQRIGERGGETLYRKTF